MRKIMIAFIVLCCAMPALATNYYLSPTGNDGNSGTSTGTAWLTPNHALNCGDVITAAAGSYGSNGHFSEGNWGTVSNCSVVSQFAYLNCATFDGCKIAGTNNYTGIWVDKSNWAVEGWEVTISGSTNTSCFQATPNTNTLASIHHVLFANNVANSCDAAGFATYNQGSSASVDYIAIVGNIAYNGAQGSGQCGSGISVYQPIAYDSAAGTHIFIAGNFSYANVNSNPCAGTAPTDGEGIILDTFDGSQGSLAQPYCQQAVVENNVVFYNGGKGVYVYNNAAGSCHAPIVRKYNTAYGDLLDMNQIYCSLNGDLSTVAALDVVDSYNLIQTNAATGCAGNAKYAFSIANGDSSDTLNNNWIAGVSGNNTSIYASTGFGLGAGNTIGTSPAFSNPVNPGAPSCSGTANTVACMSTVIADYTPTVTAAKAYGYQTPSATAVTDALYPQWLCAATIPSGLVTSGCGAPASGGSGGAVINGHVYISGSFLIGSAGATQAGAATTINVGSTVIQTGMQRVGMNIEGQDFYDSGQMLKNLSFRNPGFEAGTWQTILHCTSVTATSCTDGNQYNQWPVNFLQGGTYTGIYGGLLNETGTITSMSIGVQGSSGVTVNFAAPATAPTAGDFMIVKLAMPGNGWDGWSVYTSGGGTVTSETTDISSASPGVQAVALTAPGSSQEAKVDAYFDTNPNRRFLTLNGQYTVSFRAKLPSGVSSGTLAVTFGRAGQSSNYLTQYVNPTSSWANYSYTFSVAETSATAPGILDLTLECYSSSALIDDVSITPVETGSNTTPFRDEVVNTLIAMHPGTLRYMDSGGPMFGSSFDNMIAVPFARQRSGSSGAISEEDDVPLGLHEFLQLCQFIGADPWWSMPPSLSPQEMTNVIEYFAGSSTGTTYGAKRAALGQTAPWTSVFNTIHLELGNEQWNNVTFPDQSINDSVAYGKRITAVYANAKSAPDYSASKFDLIMGSFVNIPYWSNLEAQNASNYDSIAVAPYLFGTLADTSSTEAIFGPMFAEPESEDTAAGGGYMYQQWQTVVGTNGKRLVDYEENMATQGGTATQAQINSIVPSVAGGVNFANHFLMQMRELGVGLQEIWSLPGYSNTFNGSGGASTTPVFGTVIDMGGPTNLRRPVFLAGQLVNTAILPQMLGTSISGTNPTWNQAQSSNDNVQLNNAHYLQSYAFTDGGANRSVVVVNLSRTTAYPISFSGTNAPTGTVTINQLTSANLTDTNETSAVVVPTSTVVSGFSPAAAYSLPPFSATVFKWQPGS